MGNDVDFTRALNAIALTLNDQKLSEFDADRVQEICNGATGGERQFTACGSGSSGELRDGSAEGPPIARFTLTDGEWSAKRIPEEHKSDELEQFEQERSEGQKTMYQKPIRGRLAIWKKRIAGG